MKKNLFIFFLFCSLNIMAQKPGSVTKPDIDKALAEKGARLSLRADKDLLEANESTVLSIWLLIPPKTDADDIPVGLPTEIKLPDSEVSPYKITNWRIVEGGGNLITEELTASYTSPPKAPENKLMIISIDCEPLSQNYQKVQLLKTIYFSQNETAVVLNMPTMGIVNAKFVSNISGGIKMPNVPSNVKLPPDVQAKMEAAQKMAQAQNTGGYNTNALLSNNMAIYNPKENITAVRFSDLGLQAMDGSLQIIPKMGILGISFKGKGQGSYSLVGKDVGLAFAIPSEQNAFGCSKDTKDNDHDFSCTGNVVITKDDGKTLEGHFATKVFSSVGKEIVVGNIYGKFSALKAN
jgi:hypothetical protein